MEAPAITAMRSQGSQDNGGGGGAATAGGADDAIAAEERDAGALPDMWGEYLMNISL